MDRRCRNEVAKQPPGYLQLKISLSMSWFDLRPLTVVARRNISQTLSQAIAGRFTEAFRIGIFETVVESILRQLEPVGIESKQTSRVRVVNRKNAAKRPPIHLELFHLRHVLRKERSVKHALNSVAVSRSIKATSWEPCAEVAILRLTCYRLCSARSPAVSSSRSTSPQRIVSPRFLGWPNEWHLSLQG